MALGWLAGGESFTILHGLEPAESAALLDLLDRHQPKRQIPDLGLRIFFPLPFAHLVRSTGFSKDLSSSP
jgi:hypothetical protein